MFDLRIGGGQVGYRRQLRKDKWNLAKTTPAAR
jgi:hypothetical protein